MLSIIKIEAIMAQTINNNYIISRLKFLAARYFENDVIGKVNDDCFHSYNF